VELGGHSVREEVVRRRYAAGLRNFFALYQRLVSSWQVCDNSQHPERNLIASGSRGTTHVAQADVWTSIVATMGCHMTHSRTRPDATLYIGAVEGALRRAAAAARRDYVRAGLFMAVWCSGHIAWIKPSEFDAYRPQALGYTKALHDVGAALGS
jgi:hypothetical protein